jgi:hypothetical protein
MLELISNFEFSSYEVWLNLFGINVDEVTLEGYKHLSQLELERLRIPEAPISLYAISNLLLHFTTHTSQLRRAYFLKPGIELDLFSDTSECSELQKQILNGSFLESSKQLSVYEKMDSPESYYVLTCGQFRRFNEVILASNNDLNLLTRAAILQMLDCSDSIILKIEND